jgi:hypothetical protein
MRVLIFVALCALVARADAQLCALDYTGPTGGPCVACAAAKYKDSVGSEACTACRARSTSPEASTSSSACLCNAGLWLFSSGSGCIGCEASTYKDVIGNQACTACPANTYPAEIPNADWLTPRMSSTCMTCPSGSSCTDSNCWDVNYCRCNPGHYGPAGGPCPACDAGTYMPEIGYDACVWCQPGEYQDQIGATSCKQCPPGTSSESDYGYDMRAVTCTGCPVGSVFRPASNACVTCGANTVWSDALSKCVCVMGFQLT